MIYRLTENNTIKEVPQMKEPVWDNELNEKNGYSYLDWFVSETEKFEEQKTDCKEYPVINPPSSWMKGIDLIEGVHFFIEMRNEYAGTGNNLTITISELKPVAIPLSSPQNNCAKHKKEVAGISDMKELAEMIVQLHHEPLAELFRHLPESFQEASDRDYEAGNNALGYNQKEISFYLRKAQPHVDRLWQISKPFMNDQQK